MNHKKLFRTRPELLEGVFRCGPGGDSGVRVEVLESEGVYATILLGFPEHTDPIYVNKHTAGVLRDFFTDLAEVLDEA